MVGGDKLFFYIRELLGYLAPFQVVSDFKFLGPKNLVVPTTNFVNDSCTLGVLVFP